MAEGLVVKNLTVERGGKKIFTDLSFDLLPGQIMAVQGPNGSGKSSLALTLLGHSSCQVTGGTMKLGEADLLALPTHERAKLGLFLAHQEPPALAGVTIESALRSMDEALHQPARSTAEFFAAMRLALSRLNLADDFAMRFLNDKFSGGEKKRAELLFLLLAKPKIAILDELDSGLDEAGRELARQVIADLAKSGVGVMVISHNAAWLASLQPTSALAFPR